MRERKTAKTLFAALVIAIIAAGGSTAALADDTPVSEKDALEQGVVLYEKMQNYEIGIPSELVEEGYDEIFVKSVILGFANLDDYDSVTYDEYIRKQDFMNILYKTVINYDPHYALSEEETNEILNECYDNAYLDEENRTAYAFMIKLGIITDKLNSKPNSNLSWDSCAILVEEVYNYFVNDNAVSIGDTVIRVGRNISTVTDKMGLPNRIEESDYGFEWYVYDGDYKEFVMIGVSGDRICAFFTNAEEFSYKGVASGDPYAKAVEYETEKLNIYTAADGTVDGISYNPMQKETNTSADAKKARALELLDMINANRTKNGRTVYSMNDLLNSEAYLYSIGSADEASDSTITELVGYDIFSIYSKLVNGGTDIIESNNAAVQAIGLNVSVNADDDNDVRAQLVTNRNTVAGIELKQVVSLSETEETSDTEASEDAEDAEEPKTTEEPKANETAEDTENVENIEGTDTPEAETGDESEPIEVTAPEIISPTIEDTYEGTEDIVIELAEQAAEQYHVEVFDYENDDYIVNKYITTTDTSFALPAELFEKGRDYRIVVSSVDTDGTALSADPILVSYGSEYNSGVEIKAPYNAGVTEDDKISVQWESKIYNDFYVDLYDQNGDLIVSQVVEGKNEVEISGVDPGNYYLYVTALRRGSIVEKAQDFVTFTVTQPQPVINEIILEPDETYNFVYEDEELGVLYFYDQDIVEVEVDGETVKRKKIIQKQVKSTKAYRQLASMVNKLSSTTGSTVITGLSAYGSSEMGNAIVQEAEKYLGVPYVWGGTSPSGFDCSGLVQYVCASLGIEVNRVAEDQFTNGTPVNKDELIPGDLLFFESNGYIHHVAIYAGNGMMIHAPSTGDVVRYADFANSEYYQSEYAGARRVY